MTISIGDHYLRLDGTWAQFIISSCTWRRWRVFFSRESFSTVSNISQQVLVFLSPVTRSERRRGRAVARITIQIIIKLKKYSSYRVLSMLWLGLEHRYSRRHCFDFGCEVCPWVLMTLLHNLFADREIFYCTFLRVSSATNRHKSDYYIVKNDASW